MLEGKGSWLLAEVVLALRKSPLLSLPTFPCEMDGLVALLDEESGLPVVHVSCSESGGSQEHTLVEFGRGTCPSAGFALVAAC